MIEIQQIDEVYRFRLANSLLMKWAYFTGAYYVDGLMIDSGCAYTVKELAKALQDLSVERIINTHSHEDHIGGNAWFQKRFQVKIWAHPLALSILNDPRKTQPLQLYRKVFWGYPQPSLAAALPETVETAHHRFQVVHTPGHSPDHICLYEPEKGWIFTGDLFVGGRDQALRADYNIWEILASLKKIAKLDLRVMFTGSGTVYQTPREAIRLKIDYLENLGGIILKGFRMGLTDRHLLRKVFGSESAIAYITFGHFSSINLIRSFIQNSPEQNPSASHPS